MTTRLRALFGALVLVAPFGLLYWASHENYLLFHSLAELFSIVVAFALFAIAWNSRRLARNDSLLFLGISLAVVAIADLLHLLTYKGMGVIGGSGSDLPTQLWLIGRYQFTLAFLLLPVLIANEKSRSSFRMALGGFFVLSLALYAALFIAGVFPVAFVEGQGLTAFKKVSEYGVCALLLVAWGLLYRERAGLARPVFWLLSGSILATIVSELFFTLYADPYGLLNLMGHYLKIVAVFLLYKAMVETTLVRPYSLLFRELREREQELARSESEFRSTFEQAAVGMARVDVRGRLLLANERLGTLLGYGKDELKRVPAAALLHPNQREKDIAFIHDVIGGEMAGAVRETQLLRKDGSLIRARLTASPILDFRGAPQHALLVVEDITESKRIEREREELLARLQAVSEVTDAAMRSLELEATMRNILECVARLMKADVAVINLRSEDRLTSIASLGLEAEVRQNFSLAIGEGFSGRIAATGRPGYVADAQTDPLVVSRAIKQKGVRTMLGVPLKRGDEMLGVLHVDWLTQRPLDEGELLFLELVADRVSLALFNAELYQRQREVAEALQQEMVAVPETLPGIRFGHVYRSATEGANVGGDFYDIFAADDSRVWIVIGDVSGHGIEAATAATLVREISRALALEALQPAVVAQRLNRAVVHRLGYRHFATMFLGCLDTNTDDFDFCSAGHPPGYVLRNGAGIERLPTGNYPIGAFGDSDYLGHRTDLRPGDTLVLYTDGVLEARNGRDFFGDDRLMEVLGRANAPETIPEEVLAAVQAFSRGRLVDDLAVVCISPV
jgi:PAS domain S-box-containing protein